MRSAKRSQIEIAALASRVPRGLEHRARVHDLHESRPQQPLRHPLGDHRPDGVERRVAGAILERCDDHARWNDDRRFSLRAVAYDPTDGRDDRYDTRDHRSDGPRPASRTRRVGRLDGERIGLRDPLGGRCAQAHSTSR